MLEILFSFVMLVLVLLLAYYSIRWMGKRSTVQGGSRMIRVVDKVMVGQDKLLLVVRVQEKTMLIGMTPHAVEKLCDLETTAEPETPPQTGTDFSAVLSNALQEGWGKRKKKKEGDLQ